MIEDFSICHLCQRHRWGTLSWEYLRKFAKKFETSLMVYSGAWGKLIHEKNQKQKSHDTVPLREIMNLSGSLKQRLDCGFITTWEKKV